MRPNSIVRKIAHIINPFKAPASSDLFVAQPITFHSMLRAKKKAEGIVDVQLYMTFFAEDAVMETDGFQSTPHLMNSVLDKGKFDKPIKLPFIHDILERLYFASDAEYLIYTNVDIGLYPDFYLKVNEFIDCGHDAFIINRRRLNPVYREIDDLERIYREIGSKHPGFDCFVFHRDLFPFFCLNGICIGVPFIEISFSQNLFAFSKNFKLFEDEILTFHIGMEIFRKRAPAEYVRYNRRQFRMIMEELKPFWNQKKLPYAYMNFFKRTLKRAMHPCIPIRYALMMEWNQFIQRVR